MSSSATESSDDDYGMTKEEMDQLVSFYVPDDAPLSENEIVEEYPAKINPFYVVTGTNEQDDNYPPLTKTINICFSKIYGCVGVIAAEKIDWHGFNESELNHKLIFYWLPVNDQELFKKKRLAVDKLNGGAVCRDSFLIIDYSIAIINPNWKPIPNVHFVNAEFMVNVILLQNKWNQKHRDTKNALIQTNKKLNQV